MPHGQTQPRVGHLKGVSRNDVAKGGRPQPEGQPRVGHLKGTSTNDISRKGSTVENPNRQGYGKTSQDPQPPSPRRIDDHVSKAEGGEY